MKKPNPLLWAVAAMVISPALSQAAVFSDFEPPTYVADTTFLGTDGWNNYSGDGTAYVTPDLLPTGDLSVLQGTQSAALNDGGLIYKSFASAGITLTDDTTISFLINTTTTSGQERMFFSPDGGSTPAGLILNSDGKIAIFDPDGYSDTTQSYVAGDTYQLSMALDLSGGTFTAYSQDITTGGAVQDLGTYTDYAISAGGASASGDIFIGAGALTTFDDIEVSPTGAVPEPSTVALMAAALLVLGFRLRKYANA